MPEVRRYVLLRHECPPDYRDGPHWDLMVEDGDALRTWSLLELPQTWGGLATRQPVGGVSVLAQELPPHRVAYLAYEGEVSGGRGTVERIAAGECRLEIESAERLAIFAESGELSGEWRLIMVGDCWELTVC